MIREAIEQIKPAVILLVLMTLLTGLIYPLVVTVLAQWWFPWQANGSLLQGHGRTMGSLWIGQSFSGEKYFWGRPSATTPFPYNAENSSGSNAGPTNPDFLSLVKKRALDLRQSDPKKQPILPMDLVTASGSGLDPEISPFAAWYQIPRIAKARKISGQKIESLVQSFIKYRFLGVLGEPRVNVLQLNFALDDLYA
jgi:K+-transporting ATPase ATPase C chain